MMKKKWILLLLIMVGIGYSMIQKKVPLKKNTGEICTSMAGGNYCYILTCESGIEEEFPGLGSYSVTCHDKTKAKSTKTRDIGDSQWQLTPDV